jgi:hypothetical protein
MAAAEGPRIYLVDSHHHALAAWDREKLHELPSPDVSLVHFDAHADLGIPDISWHLLKEASLGDLQSALDCAGDASIAEWITPLVVRGLVSNVHWVIPWFVAAPDCAAQTCPTTAHDWLPQQSIGLQQC